MSAAERLLSRLDSVHSCGPGRWIARCPAHPDKRASLSIREMDDGRVLLHDFAGCDTGAVLGAVGLRLADLFDAPADHRAVPARHRGHEHALREVLEVLRDEARIIVIIAGDVASGRPITEGDCDRAATAAGRIAQAVGVLYGR